MCREDVEKDANHSKNIFNDQSLTGINSEDRNPVSVMYASQNQSALIAKRSKAPAGGMSMSMKEAQRQRLHQSLNLISVAVYSSLTASVTQKKK